MNKEYFRAYYQEHKQEHKKRKERFRDTLGELKRIKEELPCIDCGQAFHPVALAWTPKRGEGKIDIASIWGKKKLLEALGRSEVCCLNCKALRKLEKKPRS